MRRNKHKIILILICLTIAVAWGHSAMPLRVSQAESGGFLAILGPFFRLFMPDEWVTDHFIRKLAHFTEYTLMGIELATYLRTYQVGLKLVVKPTSALRQNLILLYLGFTIAFLDETIQIFSGRGPMIADVWLDLAGVVFGGLIVNVIIILIKKKRNKMERI